MSIRPPHRQHDRLDFWAFAPVNRLPRRFKVVLHRTAEKNLMFVAQVVMELTKFGTAEAEHRMWEVHHGGRSLVVVTHLERAELFVEQFADRGLAATIEPE